ncbi:MAG: hypothetical protein FWB83_01780 [Treponema sp.]|nr:hypothetical protein [Treponema sp.]
MKKFVLTGLAILLALSLSTCEIAPVVVEGGSGFTDVVYSADGKSLTLYLDGAVVPQTKASRALTDDLAKMGYDYFEVVFFHREAITGGASGGSITDSGIIARASWEIGQSVGITGVHRTYGGVDYGTVMGIPALLDVSGDAAEISTAVIFIGRKSDKTLLAVGRIVSTDHDSTAVITNATKSVTFQVAALTAGVAAVLDGSGPPATYIATGSSFLTAVDGPNQGSPEDIDDPDNATVPNTLVKMLSIGGVVFPLFELAQEEPAIAAVYNIGCTGNYPDYEEGIRISSIGGVVTKREPRYPAGGGFYNYANFTIDQRTGVDFNNNKDADEQFNNRIEFMFDTDTKKTIKSLFAITFSIPVYALTSENASSLSSETPAETWYIRPGYGTYMYDLDDGEDGPGGMILLGTNIDGHDPISVITRPW